MAAERHAPDAIQASSGLSGAVTDIDDDPDSPDANWLTTTGQNQANSVRVSFPSPSGEVATGAGLQEFRAQIRLSSTNNGKDDGTWEVYLWESGGVLNGGNPIATGTGYGGTGGTVVSGTWDASLLSGADGSGVECRVVGTAEAGGSPQNRGALEVGAVEWNAEVSAGGETVPESGSDDALASDSATAQATHRPSGSDSSLAADSASAALVAGQAGADEARGADSASESVTAAETVSEEVRAADSGTSSTTSGGTTESESVADGVGAQDEASLSLVLPLDSETAALGDSAGTSVTARESVIDAARAASSVSSSSGDSQTVQESVSDGVFASDALDLSIYVYDPMDGPMVRVKVIGPSYGGKTVRAGG